MLEADPNADPLTGGPPNKLAPGGVGAALTAFVGGPELPNSPAPPKGAGPELPNKMSPEGGGPPNKAPPTGGAITG